ncbi:MAG: VanW family protein [Peptoniphilus sp.]|nr:VanW family protein [Peptoniphilus sp.]MDY3119140.1 VanW family protein [Peptoniphilus sp.]
MISDTYLHFRHKKRRRLKRKKRKRVATIAGFVVAVYFIAVGVLPTLGIISPGTDYCGYKLGFLTVRGAERKLEKRRADFASRSVRLTHKKKSATLTTAQLGLSMPVEQAAKDALKESRERHLFGRVAQLFKGDAVDTPLKVDQAILNRRLRNLDGVLYATAKPATVAMEGDRAVIRPGSKGEVPDVERAKKDLSRLSDETVEIETRIVEPAIEAQALAGIDGKLAEAVTEYDVADKNRAVNVENGAKYFRRIVLVPGEKLSFLSTIGGITEDHGFVEGKTVSNGVETEGTGGGVCQVSTTMYNAVARAGLEVITKFNHSKPVPYAQEGLDCAVSDGYKDFIFSNPYTKPVYIETVGEEGKLRCTIYGAKGEKPYAIDLVTEKVKNLAASDSESYTSELPGGEVKVLQKKVDGSVYNTYAVYSQNGREVKRVLCAKSRYVPVDGKVLIGKGK